MERIEQDIRGKSERGGWVADPGKDTFFGGGDGGAGLRRSSVWKADQEGKLQIGGYGDGVAYLSCGPLGSKATKINQRVKKRRK